MKRKLCISFILIILFLFISCNLISCYLKKLTLNLLNDSYRTYGCNVSDKYEDNISAKFYKEICIRIQDEEIASENYEFNINGVSLEKDHVTINYQSYYYAEKSDGTLVWTDTCYCQIKYKMQNCRWKVVDWDESLP